MKTIKTLFRLSLVVALSLSAFAHADDDVKALWKSKCKNCHGDSGKADTKEGKKLEIEDMTIEKWQTKWTDDKIKDMINNGSKDKPKMKAFKDKLKPDQIESLVKYIRTLKA